MKHLFIVNPTAGGEDHSPEIKTLVERIFSARDDEYEIYVTKAPLDAADKIRADASSGDQLRVYACGGDGTFNECVCGAALLDNVAVCPYPTGTGNDFCRMFGEEKDMFRNLEALVNGVTHKIDLIDCNGRYSANICSVGIDARIGTEVHNYSHLPIIGGATGYVVSAVVNIFRGITRHMKISSGDYSHDGKVTLVAACNGRYYGGGFNPSTTAMPNDGVLDIIIAKDINIFQFAALIGRYAKGRAGEMKKFVEIIHGDSVTIEFDEDNVVNLDGEAIFTRKAEMRLVHNALNLIVPASTRFFG